MRRVVKFFSYLIVLLALIIIFMPKSNLYYAAEILMSEKKLFIWDEEVADKGYALELNNAKFIYESLSLADVENVTLSPWIFYNAIGFSNIHVNEDFADFLPLEIQKLSIEHVIYDPTNIILRADSNDNYLYGKVDLLNRLLVIHLRLDAKSEQRYKIMLERLNKEEGGYVYEYQF